ncbi:DUF5689 domain-containing protein [uncultured Alistipes sp.]|jgi:hypothetical protein|uniref:DUF5689 domain-containing protein n=1 Tax=uncultured Alistipes sp. TaxID=538949 RepID=UPI0025ECC806|nr:DUF5689 domain-containing protein [uncultured Alistipes sp.]
MNRLFKLSFAAVVGLLFVGCYNDYDAPKPAKIYTRADMEAMKLEYISIKDLKARFKAAHPGDGPTASWEVEEPLYTCGKVISSDRDGNVYKTVYMYDAESESAIEIRLNTGNYIAHPVGQIVFVKLQGLVIGNYRGMTSIGKASTPGSDYSNANIEEEILQKTHIFSGAQEKMLQSDTLVITRNNYSTLTDDALGRLVRFEDIESKFGTALWGYKNTFPNYFMSAIGSLPSDSFDVNSPGWEDIPTWASWGAKRMVTGYNKGEIYFYGSAWFTYDATAGDADANGTAPKGNYVVRSSGYSYFRDNKIPADGKTVTFTAIYTKYTSGTGRNATYQLVLNTDRDVIVK